MTVRSYQLVLLALALATGRNVAAIEVARVDLAADFLAGAVTLEASGFGGRQKGSYRIDVYSGEFKRRDTEWNIGDSKYVAKKGRKSLTLTRAGLDTPYTSTCEMRKGSAWIGAVTFDPKKLRYNCTLGQSGSAFHGTLDVGQAKRETAKDKLLAGDLRRGIASLPDGTLLDVRSVHRYRGSRFFSQEPVGYLLESGDRLVAALELTDVNPVVYLPKDGPGGVDADLVMLVALTISLLQTDLE